MGLEIEVEQFAPEDYERFTERLHASLAALRAMLGRPGFGEGPTTIGAELELHLVDADGKPAPINRAVLTAALDERVTLEMNQYNVELNTRPVALAGRPFERMAAELTETLDVARRAAREHDADVVTIGILPTLAEEDLRPSVLTNSRRYRALSSGIRRERGEPAIVRIEGREVVEMMTDDVTCEGANTSFQIHLRVTPDAFARTFNAAQIATPLVLAIAGNSPIFLGRCLWDETRVALFRQAVEDRCGPRPDDWRPARVTFGHGWVRASALDLFAETVYLHAPLLPQCSRDEDPEAVVQRGGVPPLRELRLHNGTVWRWNRAVYDPADGGHLRVEMRALPAGPTIRDMIANAAFAIGLTVGLAPEADRLVTRMTFGQARRSFYEAARLGLDAELLWPTSRAPSPRASSAAALASELLSVARAGLVSAGVAPDEADEWLSVVAARVARRVTGAAWQRSLYAALARDMPRERAAREMLRRYRELSDAGDPVHLWPDR